MALTHILDAIKRESQDQVAEILSQGQSQAQEIVRIALKRQDDEAERYLASQRERLERASVRDLHRARMEQGRALSELRQHTFLSFCDAARAELEEIRGDSNHYVPFFQRMAEQACSGLGPRVVLIIDSRDQKLAGDFAQSFEERGGHVRIEPRITTAGGVKATDDQERIWRDNTLESRLDRILATRVEAIWEVLE